jgi:hypothetical protein
MSRVGISRTGGTIVGLATGGLFVVALLASPAGPAASTVDPAPTTEAATSAGAVDEPEPITVALAAENGSARTGTATLRALDASRVEVAIELAGPEPRDNIQPVQIHAVSCAVYRAMNVAARDVSELSRLAHVVDNRSVSVADVALEDLTTGSASIAVHDLGPPFSRLVACGNIPASRPG